LLLWSPRQPGRHVAIELKVPPDKLRPEQESCIADLADSGFETYVITPDTFDQLVGIFGRRAPGAVPYCAGVGWLAHDPTCMTPGIRGGWVCGTCGERADDPRPVTG